MNALIEKTATALQTIDGDNVVAITPMAMIAQAVTKGADLTMIERLMALQERVEANDARKAYVSAMAEFKTVEISIVKDKQVSFESRNNDKGKTEYKHATLGSIAETVGPILAKFGLSYRWETEQLEGGVVQVTCIVRHTLGHSESTTLRAGLDQSGGKNNIQALGSSVSYLQRYTLMSALGLASSEMDDDGAGSDDLGLIDMDMVRRLQEALANAGGDLPAFCKYMRVSALAEIKINDLQRAWEAINRKAMARDLEEPK